LHVLITGGAGFLGSHLCEYLLGKGHRITVMDNLLTGSASNLVHLQGPDFAFIQYDVRNYLHIEGDLDFVLHFASPASPFDYLKYPIETLTVGSQGTQNALGLAKAKDAGFLIASTSEVYGDPATHPQTEDYWGNVNPIGIRGVYDEAKRYAEAMTMAYHRYHQVDTRIVRIFNTFGPRMRKNDGRAVPTFINQAMAGEDITVFGDGSQTRSFGYVSDLVAGIYALMLSDEHEPVNIGNPEEMTVKEMAELIVQLTGSKSRLIFQDLPEDDPQIRQPNIDKAARVLGWKPEVPVRDGLVKTIEWFMEAHGDTTAS